MGASPPRGRRHLVQKRAAKPIAHAVTGAESVSYLFPLRFWFTFSRFSSDLMSPHSYPLLCTKTFESLFVQIFCTLCAHLVLSLFRRHVASFSRLLSFPRDHRFLFIIIISLCCLAHSSHQLIGAVQGRLFISSPQMSYCLICGTCA